MKKFTEWRADKKKPVEKLENIETSFGSHSIKKPKNPEKLENMETSFGSHSIKKPKNIEEAVETPFKEMKLSSAVHNKLHTKVAPMRDDNLSEKELSAVKEYTDDSSELNSMLHRHAQGSDVGTTRNKPIHDIASGLDSALVKHKTSEDLTVYTGVKRSPVHHFDKYQGRIPKETKVHLPAFTSTSTSVHKAHEFAVPDSHFNDEEHGIDEGSHKHVLELHVPKGTHAMSVRNHSFVPTENEVLLHRGHEIMVHHKPTRLSNGDYLWHAKVVGHSPKDISKQLDVDD